MTENACPARGDTVLLGGNGEMARRIREHDWATTPLGPVEQWPVALRTMLAVIQGANQPMHIAWGPERTLIYNDAYAEILSAKHPDALGRDVLAVWHEARADLEPIVGRAYAGEPIQMDDIALWVEREGHPDQAHFAFSFTPVREDAGQVAGFFCACQEITRQVLADRQLRQSEARLRSVLGGMGEAFGLLDRDFRILAFNEAALALESRPLEEIVGRSHWEVYPGSEESGIGRLFKAALAEQKPVSLEHCYTWQDGTTRWLEMRAFPVPEGLAVFWHDISDRKAAEAERLALAERTTEVLESISDAFYAVDRDWRFTYVNRKAEEWWGRSREALLGKVYWEEFPQAVDSEPYKAHLRAAEMREVVRLESVSPILGHWVDISIYPAADGGLSVYFRDITDKKRMDAELRESEARFRLMADAAPQIVWITNADGRTEFFNKQWTDYTGATYQPDTAAEVAASFVHPDDAEATMAAFDHARATGATFLVEHRIRSTAGDYRWFLVRGEPYRDPRTGEVLRWFGASVDIHDRKLAEQQLRNLNETLERRVSEALAERNMLAKLVELTDVMVMAIDLDYNILALNAANANEFERIYGVRPKPGDNMLELLADQPEQQEQVWAGWGRGMEGDQVTFVEDFGDPDRIRPYYQVNFRPLHDDAGRQIGVYQFVIDVTEQLRKEAQLAETQEQLRQSQKMEAMGSLTGGVAHDFNNLLTPIIASLDMLLRRGLGSERERRLMDGALQSAERAKTLVQRLLAFARRQPLQPGPVDLRRLVSEMADLIASTSGPRVDLRVALPPDLPPALADANQLEMALLNLVVNARDAMPDGGVLTIAATRESVRQPRHSAKLRPGHYLRLSVRDTGTGMDEATLARAVEPFFSTKGIGKGTGLGLSMVHGLAEQLGGGLTLTSRPGEGATVDLWLPISPVAIDADEEGAKAVAALSVVGTALLVDDEELVRMSTADMLMDLGYEVVEARSAEEALHLVNEGLGPDLVVTDHLMPGLSGVDLARNLRSRRPGLPVLIVSGYAEMDGMAPGFPRLTKPFRAGELAQSLAALRPAGAA